MYRLAARLGGIVSHAVRRYTEAGAKYSLISQRAAQLAKAATPKAPKATKRQKMAAKVRQLRATPQGRANLRRFVRTASRTPANQHSKVKAVQAATRMI